jgi:hypothetical protein
VNKRKRVNGLALGDRPAQLNSIKPNFAGNGIGPTQPPATCLSHVCRTRLRSRPRRSALVPAEPRLTTPPTDSERRPPFVPPQPHLSIVLIPSCCRVKPSPFSPLRSLSCRPLHLPCALLPRVSCINVGEPPGQAPSSCRTPVPTLLSTRASSESPAAALRGVAEVPPSATEVLSVAARLRSPSNPISTSPSTTQAPSTSVTPPVACPCHPW